jgi:hypothetical protein
MLAFSSFGWALAFGSDSDMDINLKGQSTHLKDPANPNK